MWLVVSCTARSREPRNQPSAHSVVHGTLRSGPLRPHGIKTALGLSSAPMRMSRKLAPKMVTSMLLPNCLAPSIPQHCFFGLLSKVERGYLQETRSSIEVYRRHGLIQNQTRLRDGTRLKA